MRAAVIRALGRPPELADWSEPSGDTIYELSAVALNPIDVNIGAGRYFAGHPEFPYVPGCKGVGRSPDGTRVYLTGWAGSNYNYAHVINPATNQVVLNAGSTVNGIRPFTVNGKNTLMFTTSSSTCGFQVLSLTTGSVLYTIPFSGSCSWSASTAPSHGISLSPDEKRVYVMDAALDQVLDGTWFAVIVTCGILAVYPGSVQAAHSI